MTIVQEINKITVAHGGTPKGNTISQAIDALNDALAGSDQPEAHQIDDAIELLGQHIGGSSDFTTATVTLVGDGLEESEYTIFTPYALTTIDPLDGLPPAGADVWYTFPGQSSDDIEVILYKGAAYANIFFGNYLPAGMPEATVSVTGNASTPYDDNWVVITGDCTITCTGRAN